VNPILYAKLGAGAVLLGVIFYLGGLSPRAALQAQHAEWAQATANALIAQQKQATLDHNRLQGVIDAYDSQKDAPNPVDTGLAHRLYIAAAGGCAVPAPRALAGGTQTSATLPGSDPGIVGRLQAVIDACRADAAQLSVMIQLAP
jgi:hypothetical protein